MADNIKDTLKNMSDFGVVNTNSLGFKLKAKLFPKRAKRQASAAADRLREVNFQMSDEDFLIIPGTTSVKIFPVRVSVDEADHSPSVSIGDRQPRPLHGLIASTNTGKGSDARVMFTMFFVDGFDVPYENLVGLEFPINTIQIAKIKIEPAMGDEPKLQVTVANARPWSDVGTESEQ